MSEENKPKLPFKLLAVRPLIECSAKYSKALERGRLYPFYNNYTFKYENENDRLKSEITGIEINDTEINKVISEQLYNLDDNKRKKDIDELEGKDEPKKMMPKVSVAAVVGKNGSGKSTLFDLFYLGVYLVSKAYKLLDGAAEKKGQQEKPDLPESVMKKLEELSKYINESIKKEKIAEYSYDRRVADILEHLDDVAELNQQLKEKTYSQLKKEGKDEYEELLAEAKMECYYEKDEYYYRFRFNGSTPQKADICMVSKENSEADISWLPLPEKNAENQEHPLSKHFFYTISMSYAHYGLNAKNDGKWINELFHKNDAYQTPLVINPMRVEGNIDINKENRFAIQRLLSNILEPVDDKDKENLRMIAPGKIAERLEFKFYVDDIPPLTNVTDIEKCVSRLYSDYCRGFTDDLGSGYERALAEAREASGNTILGSAYRYLCNKVVKICKLYEDYKGFLLKENYIDMEGFCTKIVSDKSHITFKLKQAMNYIRFQMIKSNEIKLLISKKDQSQPDENAPYVTIEDLSIRIDNYVRKSGKEKPLTVMELLPPPIFKVEIKLQDGSFFSQMSSGEKQKIYCLSSIVYHLINVNSVHEKVTIGVKKEDDGIIRYSSINILFDEVEQYFHPELQRTFVKDLLGYLARINEMHVKHIKSIQILFATHSPFILSDIPSENVLMLESGKIKATNTLTFAANINEMLADNFFMGGSIGAYAEEKIEDLLEFGRRVEVAEESKIDEMKSEYDEKKKLFYFVANATGEGYIRGILENHLDEIEYKLRYYNSRLEKKIKEAQEALDKLKKMVEND